EGDEELQHLLAGREARADDDADECHSYAECAPDHLAASCMPPGAVLTRRAIPRRAGAEEARRPARRPRRCPPGATIMGTCPRSPMVPHGQGQPPPGTAAQGRPGQEVQG